MTHLNFPLMDIFIPLALLVAIYLGAARAAEEATQMEIVDMTYVSTQRSSREVSHTYLLT